MVMKAVKLDETAIKAALGHGSTVNLGILEMERLLKGYQKPINDAINEQKRANSSANCTPIRVLVSDSSPDCLSNAVGTSEKDRILSARERFMSTPIPSIAIHALFNDAYWKKMTETVEKAVEPHVGV